MTSEKTKFDYKGFHVTGDILLTKYPSNMIDLVRDCIKHSNLTVVSEHIEQFTPEASTVVWVLSESHFSLHEYPESNYVTVDCYTCGKEGNPLAAINHLVKVLDELVGVEDKDIKELKRGEFRKTNASFSNYEFEDVEDEMIIEMESKLDKVCKNLTDEQVEILQDILDFAMENKEKMI